MIFLMTEVFFCVMAFKEKIIPTIVKVREFKDKPSDFLKTTGMVL